MTEPIKRCAIYTRKSHEEGLEQEFNSLDAQRESGEAYIASQKFNGWMCLPERYDDAAYSGSTLDRPALKRLIADIEAGKVDIVVVYKIDRLSRSLLDFSELQTVFDSRKVSFVSVTQAIDTSNPTGRMMLNILMTFAQFERETIAERIRDKMSASRRKGKWVGGSVAYGYRVENKKLVIDSGTVETVKWIFRRFIEIQSPKQIVSELNARGTPRKTDTPWNTGHVYRLLNNRTYIGEVDYKGEICQGEHEPIVAADVWSRTREILQANAPVKEPKGRVEILAPLKGILRCGHCHCAMGPSYTIRHGKKYHYYLCEKDLKRSHPSCKVGRVAAGDIEDAVVGQVTKIFRSPFFQEKLERSSDLPMDKAIAALRDITRIWDEMYPAERNRMLALLLEKAVIYDNGLELEIRTAGIKELIQEVMND